MNGPRTNQFVAPTSFITSISRRREKIERRIVFAISSVDGDEQQDAVAIVKIDLDHVRNLEHRLESCLPSSTFATPGASGRSSSATLSMSSASLGVTSIESGSGLYGKVLDELRVALLHALERLSFETNFAATSRRRSPRAAARRDLLRSRGVAWGFVLKSTFTTSCASRGSTTRPSTSRAR